MWRKKFIKKAPRKSIAKHVGLFFLGVILGLSIILAALIVNFEQTHEERVFPGISIAHVSFAGYKPEVITSYWLERNSPYDDLVFTFQFENNIATLSGKNLDLGFDATLSATQAYSIGRSGNFWTDLSQKYMALTEGINLNPLFNWKKTELNNILDELSQKINIAPENALFEFQNGRVVAFKPAKTGRSLDVKNAKSRFINQLELVANNSSPSAHIVFNLKALPQEPLITTEQANNFSIEELIGSGESFFRGSIPGRIHNVALAASRINGVLIPPGKIFSFNETVGDISAATGYKQAYVIKSGRTVLDDGGGVCQVSTTFFRAALNSGLPINERHAHSYRVGYYEQGGWKPGFDATVYAPSYDLKVLNDTPAYILIQSNIGLKNQKLTFELYGKKDGRKVEISPVRLWDSRPAPPDLYQDDPTLPIGTVKQVDWANPGVKAEFDYLVTRNGEEIIKQKFFSNFIPWQAVYLRGTASL